MRAAFFTIIAVGIIFSLYSISVDSVGFVNPPFGLILFMSGPYLLLLLSAEKNLASGAYKGKLALASIFLILTLSTQILMLTSGPDNSGVGITALPAAIAVLLQYIVSIIYLFVYFINKRK